MKLIKLSQPTQRSYLSAMHFFKLSVFCIIILTGLNLPAYSQNKPEKSWIKPTQPSWWFGVAGGVNFNSYRGYTSALNYDINASPAFNKGSGVGGSVTALIQFHQPGAIWGVMLQQGLDNRTGNFENSGRRLEAKITYFTTEPSIMIMAPKTNLYFYAGPRFGFLLSTPFTYKEQNSPEYPQASRNPKAYIKNFEKITTSMQVGVGYDVRLFAGTLKETFVVLSPYITYLPALNQNLRTIETLKLNTIRAGIVLKAGRVPDF